MSDLEILLAERAIERLILDYAAAVDAGDWELVASYYTAEGCMNRPSAPDEFVIGRSAILAAFRARPPRQSRHIVTNIRVTVTGDAAQAVSGILLFTAADGPPLVGGYADRLVREGPGWRFAERRGSLDFAP